MKIHIAITTFERERELKKLIDDIQREKGDNEISIFVYDDHSQFNYRMVGVEWFRFPFNNGKQGYWRVIDRVFQDASQHQFDYFFLLQDDCELTPDFFNETIRQWELIDDPKKVTYCTFTPTNVYSRIMWGGKAEDVEFNGQKFIKGNYVDCIFMCPRNTLERLQFRILPISLDWDRNPNQSSGVGMQMTTRFQKLKRNMYTAYSSLVRTGNTESKMNKEERKINPLNHLIRGKNDTKILKPKNEEVIVGIASIPKRINALYQTLASLEHQANKIYVALNGYTEIPEWAGQFRNVEFTLTDNIMGDANKFLALDKAKGYFFSCDDDIIYPDNYVKTMVNKLKKFGNAIVTCHGRVVPNKPIQRFYKDTEQHHFQIRQRNDIAVHIPGTGVCAFYAPDLKLSYYDFGCANMADIWLGLFAQKNQIPVICIERRRKWLDVAQIPENETIYQSNVNADEKQVELVNSIIWK